MSCYIEINGKRRSVAIGALRAAVWGPDVEAPDQTIKTVLYTFRRDDRSYYLWASKDPALLKWATRPGDGNLWHRLMRFSYRALKVPMVRLGIITSTGATWEVDGDHEYSTRAQAANALLQRFVNEKE